MVYWGAHCGHFTEDCMKLISPLLLITVSLALAGYDTTAATGGAALAGVTVRISFASKKGGAASDGSIKLSEGKLLDLAVLPAAAGSAQGASWKISPGAPAKPAANAKGKQNKAPAKPEGQH